MQTKPIDALKLWWRDINFTSTQRKALAAVAIVALAVSALYIFKPNHAEALPTTTPVIIKPAMLIVDVAGEVTRPGVYELAPNARVIDAVKAAGGAKSSADLSLINLARVVKDGEQIYIEKRVSGQRSFSRSNSRNTFPSIININRASAKELESLPGIGPVLASRIVQYRTTNGSFLSVDDLSKVPGIGASKLEKFKEKIRV